MHKVLHKNIGCVACKDISQNAAADTGQHSDDNCKIGIGIGNMNVRGFNTDYGEKTQTDCIHYAEQYVIIKILQQDR